MERKSVLQIDSLSTINYNTQEYNIPKDCDSIELFNTNKITNNVYDFIYHSQNKDCKKAVTSKK